MRWIRRWGMPLALAVGLTGELGMGAWAAVPVLRVDLGTRYLQPNTPNQPVEVLVLNQEASTVQLAGLDFRVEVDDGLGGANAPVLTGVDLVTGTPWDGHAPVVNPYTQDPEYYDVRMVVNVFSNPDDHVDLAPGSLTRMALLVVDTTGLTAGTWGLRLVDQISHIADTKYTAYGTGTEIFPIVVNGQLVIVPEPGTWAGLSAAGLLLWGVIRRRASLSSGP